MRDSSRCEELAAQFEATQDEFIKLIESLTDADWQTVGHNYPTRTNDEDEGRTIGVIAHHVAVSGPVTMGRIEDTLAGRPLEPLDIQQMNADHARDNAEVSREQVLRLLRETKSTIAAAIRAVPEDQLDVASESRVGPMTIAFRIQAILTGHITMHQGSIEAAIGRQP